VRWRNIPEVQATLPDADPVKGYVVFDFRKNRYRLITIIQRRSAEGRPKDGSLSGLS